MRNKIEKRQEKRYDKFAVVSFVLSLILVVLSINFLFTISWLLSGIFIVLILAIYPMGIVLIGMLVLGIFSLMRIRKNKNLKGEKLAIISIMIDIFFIILFVYIMSGWFLK